MKREGKFCILGLSLVFILSGCVVRTYQVTKEREDQDLTQGNRGYVLGDIPAVSEEELAERDTTRTERIIEVEFHSPVRFEKMTKPKTRKEGKAEDKGMEGNQEFITKSESPEIAQPMAMEKYTVQKNDTLQKISKEFFGTTKKWTKIYEANKDVLTSPNKLRPGQAINIPVEPLGEPKENLK